MPSRPRGNFPTENLDARGFENFALEYTVDGGQGSGIVETGNGFQEANITQTVVQQFRRFYGTARLDSARVGRDAGRIAEEVIAHLTGQMAAEVTVTIEIVASLPNGASDQFVRTVTENCRTLKVR